MVARLVGVVLACLLPLSASHAAGWVLPASSAVHANGGSLEFAQGALDLMGTLRLDTGRLDGLAGVVIRAGGVLDAGSGVITLNGDWDNQGTFVAGTSSVRFRDGGATTNLIRGNTTFHHLSFSSMAGETYQFESGSEQRIAGLLEIQGVGSAIRLLSSNLAVAARLNLLPGGTQAIANVAVNGVHAVGQRLAPTQNNQQTGGSDTGWFSGGSAFVPPEVIPIASPSGLLLLAAGVLLVAWRTRRRDTSPRRIA